MHTYYRACNNGLKNGASCNCGVATMCGDDVIVIDICGKDGTPPKDRKITITKYQNGDFTAGCYLIRVSKDKYKVWILLIFLGVIEYVRQKTVNILRLWGRIASTFKEQNGSMLRPKIFLWVRIPCYICTNCSTCFSAFLQTTSILKDVVIQPLQ